MQRFLSAAAAAILLTSSVFAQSGPPPIELKVPFPSTSPRPNASVIYCNTALNSEISATNENLAARAFVGWRARVRLMFSGNDVLLSVSDPSSSSIEYRNPTRYVGASAAQTEFAGNLYVSTESPGNASVLAVNRDTGTFLWSTVSAGGAAGSYPSSNTAFYVCGARQQ